ncbi:hypothetical protein ACETK8_14385 [Brevundimonas staleyi]|jgi:hypothetical protein|uniref:Uncharacterized protein n=1 Tax=Brevundimonas staleyi TaxID=74326 RepID=A0ABW0FUV1_9CAUL
MTQKGTRTPLVRLGAARRLTQADQPLGQFEQIPTSRYEVAGWQSA